ncbi:MAG: tetratricopeptide repeat protein [Leptolyngbyaceae cyanobacterium]
MTSPQVLSPQYQATLEKCQDLLRLYNEVLDTLQQCGYDTPEASLHEVLLSGSQVKLHAFLAPLRPGESSTQSDDPLDAPQSLPANGLPSVEQAGQQVSGNELNASEPRTYWNCFEAGNRAKKRGSFKEAIQQYRLALKLDAKLPWPHLGIGEVYTSLARFEEAIESYTQASRCDPNYPWAHHKKSQILSKLHRHDEAVEAARQATEVDPSGIWFHCQLGNALTTKGDTEEAIAAYQASAKQGALASGVDPAQLHWDFDNPRGPDFICPGFAKSGTTSLYEYIIQHPQVLPVAQKEPMFFNNHYDRGLEWYLSQIPPIPSTLNCVTGEVSTRYIEDPNAHRRLYQHFPQTKLILLLRNPSDRAISDYYMGITRGYEIRTIEAAFDDELSVFQQEGIEGLLKINQRAKKGETSLPSYILGSLYASHIQRWMLCFPKEQFLVLTSDEFYQTPEITLSKVFQFLDLPNHQLSEYGKYNSGSYDQSQAIHQRLTEFFYTQNQALEAIFDIDLSNWFS